RRRDSGDAGLRRRSGGRALPQHGGTVAATPRRSARNRCRPDARREVVAPDRRQGMSFTRYEPASARLQRSELAVPGSQPALFRKALDSDADCVFLDLEDAVAPADKEQARQHVVASLLEHDWRAHGKTVCVRINAIDTHYMYRDVVDVVEQAGHR